MALTKINYNQIKGSCVNALDYMTAAQIADITSYTGAVDCTAALDLAFANVGKQVFLPSGSYRVASNLASPTCAGIFGEGWEPGANYIGTYLVIIGTVGLDLRTHYCLTVRDICLQGNNAATASSRGILIGNSPALPSATLYTWDYGKINNVRIFNFTGAGSIGMYLRDANFCTFTDIHIDNCTQNLECCLANQGAGTVPADCWFYDLTSSSGNANGVMVRSGFVMFNNLRISGVAAAAVSLWPALGEVNTHSATVIIDGIALENNAAAIHQFRVEALTAANASILTVKNINMEMGAGEPALFVEVKAPYARAFFEGLSTYDFSNSPANTILVTNYAQLTISDNRAAVIGSTITDLSAGTQFAPDTTAFISGNALMKSWIPVFITPLTIVGAATYKGWVVRTGNMINWWLQIIPTGAGTTASAAAIFQVATGAYDLGRPRTVGGLGPAYYPVNAIFESFALSATTAGIVYDSGNQFTCKCPNWAATNDEVMLNGTYFADLANVL